MIASKNDLQTSPSKSLHIAVIGASGQVGQTLVAEALSRGHRVTAVSRGTPRHSANHSKVSNITFDVEDQEGLGAVIRNHDVVISALRPRDGEESKLKELTARVVRAAIDTGTRFIVVGGAAPLKLPDDPHYTVLSAPGFLPDAVVPIAEACQQQHDWVLPRLGGLGAYLCPPAMLQSGTRTGTYRIGSEQLVTDDKGVSQISIEDFAVAALDEAENPSHLGQQFTVGY